MCVCLFVCFANILLPTFIVNYQLNNGIYNAKIKLSNIIRNFKVYAKYTKVNYILYMYFFMYVYIVYV